MDDPGEWRRPSDQERRVFEDIVADARPRWETLDPDALTRVLSERMEAAMRDYLYNGGPPPNC